MKTDEKYSAKMLVYVGCSTVVKCINTSTILFCILNKGPGLFCKIVIFSSIKLDTYIATVSVKSRTTLSLKKSFKILGMWTNHVGCSV